MMIIFDLVINEVQFQVIIMDIDIQFIIWEVGIFNDDLFGIVLFQVNRDFIVYYQFIEWVNLVGFLGN